MKLENAFKLKTKKKQEQLNRQKGNFASIKTLDSDFIPYTCHYDDSTILTKNGNLLQVIKIEDYSADITRGSKDLRSEIRNTISRNVATSEFAIWIHTARKYNNFDLSWENTGDFSDELHNSWHKSDKSVQKYANTLYIVILIDSLNENLNGIANVLLFNYVKNKHKLYLQNKFRKLQKVVSLILVDLEPFQAKKLQIIFCQDHKMRSEILEFFNFIITLSYNKYYISEQDLFESIKDVKIAFGCNSFQVTSNNQKKFGSIVSIKEYMEVPLNNLDLCLQLNCEFIISEMIRFVKYKEAITTFQEKYDILKISEDEELRRASGLEEIIENNSLSMAFCKHKINFTIIADSTQELNKNVSSTVSTLSSIGLMTIRNDLHLEDNFWLRLPGNFVFFTQQNSIPVKYSCGFSFVHSFVSGTMKGGRWKEAITTFLSSKGNIYFFNFHSIKNSGHTIALGLPNSGRTLLINFLLSESRHLNTRTILFDNSGKSIIFVKAMNGKYYTINLKDGLQFNPLKIDSNVNNHDMLCELFKRMVGTTREGPIDTAVKKIVDYVFSIPVEYRSISKISKILEQLGGSIKKWYGDGEFANIFADYNSESFDWKEKILGINIGKLTKECMHVVLYYFLHRLEMEFDGSPTILLLDEAWKISSIFRTEEEFDNWMNRMTELNVVVIFSTENLSEALVSPFSHYVEKHIDTKILMPNPYASKFYKEIFSLSNEEFNMLLQIPAYNRHFLLKQRDRSVILTLNLSQMREVHVLSANNKTVGFMYDAIQNKGDEANKWLPEFYEKCQI
ncbi:type VI secretion protein [Candidatus Mesenet endosymbiont of Agriotes lineatus]|uniref:VirB4 family type IV secretion/conjugal transfer ATPase n=1 Tax=Candidatus Mesenet endosymbiont of Agriotes lineatus TaxID=3077948 RepID=UPI0030CC1C98